MKDAFAFLLIERTRAGAFGSVFAQNLKLRRIQLRLPFGVGLLNRIGCVVFGIHSAAPKHCPEEIAKAHRPLPANIVRMSAMWELAIYCASAAPEIVMVVGRCGRNDHPSRPILRTHRISSNS